MKRLYMTCMLALAGTLLVLAGCNSSAAPQAPAYQILAGNDAMSTGIVISQQETGIRVSGLGKVSVVPDIVQLQLGVEARRDTVEQARSDAAAAMDNVIKVLKGTGIVEKDIRTGYFNIQPIWQWNEGRQKNELNGYRVTNMVIVKVRDTAKAGSVIDDVAQAAGDLTRIDSIGFTIDDPEPHYVLAREMAVKDAMNKAAQIADAAGVKLGQPLSISEGASYSPLTSRDYLESASAVPAPSTSINPGEQELQVTVQMVYSIN